MTEQELKQGRFTLPGEAGYEKLTLELARRWGADAIRDCDGTALSEDITAADYDIYSTICLVRIDNRWAKANPDKIQQNYLMSEPVLAEGDTVTIDPLRGFFREQFQVNAHDDPKRWWQVFDRTMGEEVPAGQWEFNPATGLLTIRGAQQYHRYTVNFLAYRIWEAISMYNHITNNWGDREHLMPIDPIYPETQAFILDYLDGWLRDHPRTKIVRFTSLFYNFAWFWGDSPERRFNYADWGSYEMTVSPYALQKFAEARGYELTSEDFVNNGAYCSSHNTPSPRLLDWMDFVNEFVVSFGRQCIDRIHAAGKKAYMFYDDHWVGTEPYGERFADLGFDGLIKCVFNAFEARLCAGVKGAETKELRLHPYLFPTGLKGEPTFMAGGDPARDARRFWANIRRGLLREPVDRIGLGGYLHLVENFPDFVDAVEEITQEFRTLRSFHEGDKPYTQPVKVAVLTAWGKLRSWVYVGHFIPGMELYELTESLAGLPVEVSYISFDDILTNGIPDDVQVILNAGRVNSAWVGQSHWKNPKIVEALTAWVARGGGFIGVGEPSACVHSTQYFQLVHILGLDREIGPTCGSPKRTFKPAESGHFLREDAKGDLDFGCDVDNIFLLDRDTQVLAAKDGSPRLAAHPFNAGRSVYLSGFKFSPRNTRLLHRALCWAAGREDSFRRWTCEDVEADCAFYPKSRRLVVVNSGDREYETRVFDDSGNAIPVRLSPYGIAMLKV